MKGPRSLWAYALLTSPKDTIIRSNFRHLVQWVDPFCFVPGTMILVERTLYFQDIPGIVHLLPQILWTFFLTIAWKRDCKGGRNTYYPGLSSILASSLSLFKPFATFSPSSSSPSASQSWQINFWVTFEVRLSLHGESWFLTLVHCCTFWVLCPQKKVMRLIHIFKDVWRA